MIGIDDIASNFNELISAKGIIFWIVCIVVYSIIDVLYLVLIKKDHKNIFSLIMQAVTALIFAVAITFIVLLFIGLPKFI